MHSLKYMYQNFIQRKLSIKTFYNLLYGNEVNSSG